MLNGLGQQTFPALISEQSGSLHFDFEINHTSPVAMFQQVAALASIACPLKALLRVPLLLPTGKPGTIFEGLGLPVFLDDSLFNLLLLELF